MQCKWYYYLIFFWKNGARAIFGKRRLQRVTCGSTVNKDNTWITCKDYDLLTQWVPRPSTTWYENDNKNKMSREEKNIKIRALINWINGNYPTTCNSINQLINLISSFQVRDGGVYFLVTEGSFFFISKFYVLTFKKEKKKRTTLAVKGLFFYFFYNEEKIRFWWE